MYRLQDGTIVCHQVNELYHHYSHYLPAGTRWLEDGPNPNMHVLQANYDNVLFNFDTRDMYTNKGEVTNMLLLSAKSSYKLGSQVNPELHISLTSSPDIGYAADDTLARLWRREHSDGLHAYLETWHYNTRTKRCTLNNLYMLESGGEQLYFEVGHDFAYRWFTDQEIEEHITWRKELNLTQLLLDTGGNVAAAVATSQLPIKQIDLNTLLTPIYTYQHGGHLVEGWYLDKDVILLQDGRRVYHSDHLRCLHAVYEYQQWPNSSSNPYTGGLPPGKTYIYEDLGGKLVTHKFGVIKLLNLYVPALPAELTELTYRYNLYLTLQQAPTTS